MSMLDILQCSVQHSRGEMKKQSYLSFCDINFLCLARLVVSSRSDGLLLKRVFHWLSVLLFTAFRDWQEREKKKRGKDQNSRGPAAQMFWFLVPRNNQAPKTLDLTFPIMQQKAFSLDPSCLVNPCMFHIPWPHFVTRASFSLQSHRKYFTAV